MIAVLATLYALVVPGSLTVLIPWLLVRDASPTLAAHGWYQHLGWVPLLLGVALIGGCTHRFVVDGRGTPAPVAPPTRLVVGGWFRWTRNPMYLGVLTMLFGEAVLAWSPVLLADAAGTWLGMEAFLQLYEEPSLRRRFGADYAAYCRAVPRWFGWPWRSRIRDSSPFPP